VDDGPNCRNKAAFSFFVGDMCAPRQIHAVSLPAFLSVKQICPEMRVNEMHALYDKQHKVSSFVESHQNTHNSFKYEVM